MSSASAEVGVMIATLIAVIVANADNVCFSIMIPSLIATSVLEIAYHSKQWTDFVEGYCLHQELSAAHGVVNDEFSGRPLVQ
jgi:hypothetical protein